MTISFVILKIFRMIILNLLNTLKISSMSLPLCKDCFMLNLTQLNAFSIILLTTNNVFRLSFIVLKAKYDFSWNNQFSNFVRWSLKIFDLIILMLLNSSNVVASLLSLLLFFISIFNELLMLIIFSLLFPLVLKQRFGFWNRYSVKCLMC